MFFIPTGARASNTAKPAAQRCSTLVRHVLSTLLTQSMQACSRHTQLALQARHSAGLITASSPLSACCHNPCAYAHKEKVQDAALYCKSKSSGFWVVEHRPHTPRPRQTVCPVELTGASSSNPQDRRSRWCSKNQQSTAIVKQAGVLKTSALSGTYTLSGTFHWLVPQCLADTRCPMRHPVSP